MRVRPLAFALFAALSLPLVSGCSSLTAPDEIAIAPEPKAKPAPPPQPAAPPQGAAPAPGGAPQGG